MPRRKEPGAAEPKRRSRTGCWYAILFTNLFNLLSEDDRPCKRRKIKCGEERPQCANCQRQGQACDYGIRLNWNGRGPRPKDEDIQDLGKEDSLNSNFASIQNGPYQENFTQNSHESPCDGCSVAESAAFAFDRSDRFPFGQTKAVTSLCESQESPDEFPARAAESIPGGQKNNCFRRSVIQERLSPPPSYTTTVGGDLYRETSAGYQCSPQQHGSYLRNSRDIENMDSPTLFLNPSHTNITTSLPLSHEQTASTITDYTDVAVSWDSLHPNNQIIGPSSLVRSGTGDIHHLSVESLLTGAPGMPSQNPEPYQGSGGLVEMTNIIHEEGKDEVSMWGIDRGLQDCDIGKNDDDSESLLKAWNCIKQR